MKFLLFNITVLTALAYLVFDNGEMHKISNKIQKSSFDAIEKVKTLSKPIQENLSKTNYLGISIRSANHHTSKAKLLYRLPYPAETGNQLITVQNKETRARASCLPFLTPVC